MRATPVWLVLAAALILLALNFVGNAPTMLSLASASNGPAAAKDRMLLQNTALQLELASAQLRAAEQALKPRASDQAVDARHAATALPTSLSPPPAVLTSTTNGVELRPPPPPPPALAAATGPGCDPACERRGTCNRELGRCDCPPFFGGPDCSRPLFPACVEQWGMRPSVAVCGIHTQPAFPTSCDCLWECHGMAMDARQECVVEPAKGETMAQAEARVKQRMPWMPVIANESWLRRTKADAAATLSAGRCSGRGIYSVQLPYVFYPPDGEVHDGPKYGLPPGPVRLRHTPLCRCFPGFTGKDCEIDMARTHSLHKCFNDCSGRGECVQNFCRCAPGSWGIDCSLGAALPKSDAAHVAASGSGDLRPRVYVYDMPPRFTSWLGAMRRGDWTRDHWYGVDVILHQQLLRSPYRTLDPANADYFFIPLHLSLGFYSHRAPAAARWATVRTIASRDASPAHPVPLLLCTPHPAPAACSAHPLPALRTRCLLYAPAFSTHPHRRLLFQALYPGREQASARCDPLRAGHVAEALAAARRRRPHCRDDPGSGQPLRPHQRSGERAADHDSPLGSAEERRRRWRCPGRSQGWA